MRILKEDIADLNNYKNCKEAYRTLAQLTQSEFKKLVALKISLKSNSGTSENDNERSIKIKNILKLLAEVSIKTNDTFPKAQCKFLTDYYKDRSFDFDKLVKNSNFNLLRVRGMLVALMFKFVLSNQETYCRFLSLFSPNFPGEDKVIPDDLSFIILNSFAEAFGINNISKDNKFIKEYMNTKFFNELTTARETFEKVYNDYVSNPAFNAYKIFNDTDATKIVRRSANQRYRAKR